MGLREDAFEVIGEEAKVWNQLVEQGIFKNFIQISAGILSEIESFDDLTDF